MKPVALIHYGEIGLKGKNIEFFKRGLRDNVRKALRGVVPAKAVKLRRSRIIVVLESNHLPVRNLEAVVEEVEQAERKVVNPLSKVFGIVYFGVGIECHLTLDSIQKAAAALLKRETFHSFKVDTKRTNKAFPLTSPEINAEVGAHLQKTFSSEVKLKDPDITVYVEIGDRESYVYAKKFSGPGGLPVGCSGKVVVLLSAGFDSPIASYQIMKRGAEVVFVHFHSYPFVTKDSIDQARQLAKLLTEYQYQSRIYLVPFAETQQEIAARTPSPLRVILYRRMMIRIAQAIAEKERAEALVTGESLGQVASQTLRNIRIIEEVATLPILRPLISFDKNEIIDTARRIQTFEISSAPYDDCCSYLLPRSSSTWAKSEGLSEAEKSLDIPKLTEQALAKTQYEVYDLSTRP